MNSDRLTNQTSHVPLLEVLPVQKPPSPTCESKTRSLVHRLFTDSPEILRVQLVRVLKSLRKPFALWPVIAAFARPFKAIVHHRLKVAPLTPSLRRPLQAWSLLIVLLLGAGVGFYASSIFNEVSGIDQSTAPDFSLGTNPVSLTVPQGSLGSFTVSPWSLNSFAGSVNLNYSLYAGIRNATVALNPGSVSLLTGTGSSTLSMSLPSSASLNSYMITIGAASGSLSHNVTGILRVVPPPSPDFSITATPSQTNVTRGSSTGSTITLTSIGGFAGTVNLTTSISPSNGSSPTLPLNPSKVILLSGRTGNAVLTVNTSGTTSRGVYTVVVLGVSETLANSLSITLTVQ